MARPKPTDARKDSKTDPDRTQRLSPVREAVDRHLNRWPEQDQDKNGGTSK